jgi:hypothetical protein
MPGEEAENLAFMCVKSGTFREAAQTTAEGKSKMVWIDSRTASAFCSNFG